MTKQLIYSILQYKHSPVLEEAINVGVLFFFPGEKRRIYFNYTEPVRINKIYQDFDSKYFHSILKIIKANIEKLDHDIFAEALLNSNFKEFIHNYLLKEDDSSLQFSDIHYSLNSFSNIEKAVEEFVNLLLPLSEKKSEIVKRDDKYIIKKVKTRLFLNRPEIEKQVEKDVIVETDKLRLKFEFVWTNGSRNLIHPLSFDLNDNLTIQRKTAEYSSYLTWLSEYTKSENSRIDLLLAEPQNTDLKNAYKKSVGILNAIDTRKRLIPFDEIDNYTDEAANYLLANS